MKKRKQSPPALTPEPNIPKGRALGSELGRGQERGVSKPPGAVKASGGQSGTASLPTGTPGLIRTRMLLSEGGLAGGSLSHGSSHGSCDHTNACPDLEKTNRGNGDVLAASRSPRTEVGRSKANPSRCTAGTVGGGGSRCTGKAESRSATPAAGGHGKGHPSFSLAWWLHWSNGRAWTGPKHLCALSPD